MEHVLASAMGSWSVQAGAVDAGIERSMVARASGGDPGAYAWLLDRYRDRVLRLATLIIRRSDDAEDAAQEVFIRAFRGLKSFRGDASLGTWLYRITVRVCGERASRLRRHPELTLPAEDSARWSGPGPGGPTAQRMTVEALLDQLSPDMRAALVLRELYGLDYREVAEAVGTPIGTIRSRLHAARARFRDLYLAVCREADNV
jgi:RNA polymerase sigma-70 factor (ECF subfamily)